MGPTYIKRLYFITYIHKTNNIANFLLLFSRTELWKKLRGITQSRFFIYTKVVFLDDGVSYWMLHPSQAFFHLYWGAQFQGMVKETEVPEENDRPEQLMIWKLDPQNFHYLFSTFLTWFILMWTMKYIIPPNGVSSFKIKFYYKSYFPLIRFAVFA